MKRNWKILYSAYSGMEKKAVELVNRDLGSLLIRDGGDYAFYVLPCEKMTETAPQDYNCVLVGCYENSPLIRQYVKENEIPENGYIVKVFDNPGNSAFKIVIITAVKGREVFYGAVDFIDDYLPMAAPKSNGFRVPTTIFQEKIPDYTHASAPKIRIRSVFCWGHTISDYRDYIENLARMRINRLIIWNDYAPLNAKDIVDYAHEYGIELIWGFAWGWGTDCSVSADLNDLEPLKQHIVEQYKRDYLGRGDGIYFQSFTELHTDHINGKLIAEIVAEFVNDVAHRLYELSPELSIEFGLHATSVYQHLEYFEKIDPRIEILWEDCGAFPYNYDARQPTEEEYLKTQDFTDLMLRQRNGQGAALAFKGLLTMDWHNFEHQAGPFILGDNGKKVTRGDTELFKPMWRYLQSDWILCGETQHRLTNHILNKTGGNVHLNIVGQINGGIWLPMALSAQILWDPAEDYQTLMHRVMNRPCIQMA